MAQAIIGYIAPAAAKAVAAGAASATQLLTYGAVSVGVSLTASYALAALQPKPDFGGAGGLLVNGVDPTADAQYVFGEVRKGGTITYEESTNGNDVLHRIIVLAAHEVEEIGQIYLNDEPVTLSDDDYDETIGGKTYTGAGWVLSEDWRGDNGGPRIRLYFHDGSQTAHTTLFTNTQGPNAPQSLNSTLLAETDNSLGTSFVGKGLAYIYARMAIDSEAYAGGIPTITAVVKGAKVYDPRTDTTGYSANWALCVAHYLEADWGLGDAGNVDTTLLQAEADVCDENVSLAAGGTQKRYEMNGVVTASETPGGVLAQMMPSGSGSLFWGQGKWRIRAGHYTAPVADFGMEDLRSAVSIQTKQGRADSYNAVQGTFNDKAQRWIPGEYARVTSSTFVTEDGGFENALDYELPFETDAARAQRLAKLALFRQREQVRFTADFSLKALTVEPGETVTLTMPRYGWDAKEFVVDGWSLRIDGETGSLKVAMALRETSADAFNWNAEEAVFAANNTNLTSYRDTATVTLGTPSVQEIRNPGGTTIPLLFAPWTATSPQLASEYVFQWRENVIDYAAAGGFVTLSSPTAREQLVYDAYLATLFRVPDQDGFDFYVSGGGSSQTDAQVRAALAASTEGTTQAGFNSIVTRSTQAEVRALEFGKRYDLRVVSRNALGIVSAPSTTTFLVSQDTTAPPVPTFTGKTNTVIGQQVTFRWNNPATSGGVPVFDLKHTEIARNTSNTTSGATSLAEVVGQEFIDTSADPSTTYYYFARAVDFADNASAWTAGVEITTDAASTAGDGVWPIYATNSSGSNQSFSPTSRNFVYFFRSATQPTLPISGVTFKPFVGTVGPQGGMQVPVFAYRRAASQPSTPSGGSYNFDTTTLSPPSGWSRDIPSGTDILWRSQATAESSTGTGTDSSLSWSSAKKVAQDGEIGPAGFTYMKVFAYRRSTGSLSTPSGGSYNFGTDSLSPPSGWSATALAGSGTLYRIEATAKTQGETGTDTSLSWSSPVAFGNDGDRGPGRWHVPASPFSLPTSSTGARTVWNANGPFTPVLDDQVWFYTGSLANPTGQAVFICASVSSASSHTWTRQDEVIDGSLLVTNTVTSDKVDTRGLDIKDASGNVIFSASANLDWARIGGSSRPADNADVTASNTAAGIANQGNFATLDQITSANVSTYIASAAIGDAYIQNLNAAKITAGLLSALRVDIDGITLSRSGSKLVINAGGVDTAQLADDSATVAGTASSNFGAAGNGSYQNELNVTISVNAAAEIIVLWDMVFDVSSSGAPEWGYRIRRGGSTSSGGTTVDSYSGLPTHAGGGEEQHSGVSIATVSAGTHTIRFDSWMTASGGDVDEVRMVLLARMK